MGSATSAQRRRETVPAEEEAVAAILDPNAHLTRLAQSDEAGYFHWLPANAGSEW